MNDHLLRHAVHQLVQPSYRLELPGPRRPPTGINQEGERRQPENRGEQSSQPVSDPFEKGATLHETVLNCENLKPSSWISILYRQNPLLDIYQNYEKEMPMSGRY